MDSDPPFVDIHCHLVPAIDDGAADWETSLEMAWMAVDEGIETIIATPHQMGEYRHNTGDKIRAQVHRLQESLDHAGVPLRVLPGGDVRIDPELVALVSSGEVMTLADKHQHVLLELPHETYIPLQPLIAGLDACGIQSILSHPERNQGILADPTLVDRLIDGGCLMQITANSITGRFGDQPRKLAEKMICEHNVHFIATDAHTTRSRRPEIIPAFNRTCDLVGIELATTWCCHNPRRVVDGQPVPLKNHLPGGSKNHNWRSWLGLKSA